MNNQLVIITGANGRLGRAYLYHFSSKNDFDIISVSRSKEDDQPSVFKNIYADLLEQKNVKSEIDKIDFSVYKKIFLIHPVGKFKFQKNGIFEIDKDSNGIDDDVFSSNVVTLENILTPIIDRIKNTQTQIRVCAFGSISDRYDIPFWSSYSKSKNILRRILKSLSLEETLQDKISILFVNVSSVDTGNENKLRPHADKKFWLRPEEIVEKNMELLLSDFKGYKEIDTYNPIPDFDANYFHNNEKILKKWLKEMGMND